MHIRYEIKSIFAELIYKKMTDEDSHYSTIEALKKTNIPVMFARGADDHFVSVPIME